AGCATTIGIPLARLLPPSGLFFRLYRDRRADGRMESVVRDLEVLVAVVVERGGPPLDHEPRQRIGLPGELRGDLFQVVVVEMAVAADPDELTHAEIALLRYEVRQERVRGDVERHAEKDVGAALVELTGKPPVRDVELEEGVTRRELHARDVRHVPGRD